MPVNGPFPLFFLGRRPFPLISLFNHPYNFFNFSQKDELGRIIRVDFKRSHLVAELINGVDFRMRTNDHDNTLT